MDSGKKTRTYFLTTNKMNEEIEELKEEVAMLKKEIQDLEQEIDNLKDELNENLEINRVIDEAYENSIC
jgi:cell division protein FtsB